MYIGTYIAIVLVLILVVPTLSSLSRSRPVVYFNNQQVRSAPLTVDVSFIICISTISKFIRRTTVDYLFRPPKYDIPLHHHQVRKGLGKVRNGSMLED
jgi:hypothetical protein